MMYQIKKYGIENVLPLEMLKSTELKDNEKIVLAQAILYSGMGEFAGMGKGHFFRSNSSFMADCGLDSHSFRRAADGLVKKGLMKRKVGTRSKDGDFASEYRIPLKYADMNPLIMDGDFDEDFEIDVEERVVDEQVIIDDSEIDEAAPHIHNHNHKQNNNQNQIYNQKQIHNQNQIYNQKQIHNQKRKVDNKENDLIDNKEYKTIENYSNEEMVNNEAVGVIEAPTAHIPFNEEKYKEMFNKFLVGEIDVSLCLEQMASMGESYFGQVLKDINKINPWARLSISREVSSISERYGWKYR